MGVQKEVWIRAVGRSAGLGEGGERMVRKSGSEVNAPSDWEAGVRACRG